MVVARHSIIEDCYQAVLAYGGARSVRFEDCRILRSQKEGIMAAGTVENAATAAQAAAVAGMTRTAVRPGSEEARKVRRSPASQSEFLFPTEGQRPESYHLRPPPPRVHRSPKRRSRRQ